MRASMRGKMLKIATVLCLFLAIARGSESQQIAITNENKAGVENDIRQVIQGYNKNIQDYDAKLEHLKKIYLDHFKNYETTLYIKDLLKVENKFSALETLSELGRNCVTKYGNLLTPVKNVIEEISKCEADGNQQRQNLFSSAEKTRNSLYSYYNYFKNSLKDCFDFRTKTFNSSCTYDAITEAEKFTITNKNSFKYEVEAAECIAKVSAKKAIDCKANVLHEVKYKTSKANILVDNCIVQKNECAECRYKCLYTFKLKQSNPEGTMVENPFYKTNTNVDCVSVYEIPYKKLRRDQKS